jgi:hypothetical protein
MKSSSCKMRGGGRSRSRTYVDVAVRRWQIFTGKVATLAATGRCFEEIEESRTRTEIAALGQPDSASAEEPR